MKAIRNIQQLTVVRILYICILLVHLLMLALGLNAQSIKPELIIKAGKPVHPAHSRISRVREIYTSQIGVQEKQSNSGPEVEEYLCYIKLPKGNPWCAAFVCWVYGQANVPNPRTGWSPDLFPSSRIVWQHSPGGKVQSPKPHTQGSQLRAHCPKPADVFGLYFPEKGRIAHVGFVDEWNDPWLVTVEGNTNLSGSREGDGVYRKRRLVRSIHKVARYID